MVTSAIKQHLKAGDMVAGRFRIVEQIGSGGFSVVYRAHQESMNRFVALKVLKSSASSDQKTVERFRREALFASYLTHPNTIRLFDYGHTDDGMCYIAMELLRGQDLADVVRFGEPMPLGRVWSILYQSCQSLAEAHRLGLIHRDLKPENIYLVQQKDGSDFVKVLDFGVSKAVGDFARSDDQFMAPLTQKGTVFGTPLYMAPEQAMDQEISAAADVYALGHIAYEMITGQAAYGAGLSAMDVMLRQINDPPLKLPAPLDQTPFSPLITKCTLKDPEARIQDTTRLLEHLLHDAFLPYMPAEIMHRRSQVLARAVDPAGSEELAQPNAPRSLQAAPPSQTPPPSQTAPPDTTTIPAAGESPASVEIFDDLEAEAQPLEKRDAADVAFDTVLGYLAELGHSIPLDLWKLACARVIPQKYIALTDFMVEQAERFGILERGLLKTRRVPAGVESIWFTKPGYAARLRADFDLLVDPVPTHREIAQLLLSFNPTPTGAQLRRMVEHFRRGGQTHRAMRLLWQAVTRASAGSDLRTALDHCTELARIITEVGAQACEQSAANLGFHPAQVWMRAAELHMSFDEIGAAQDALTQVVSPTLSTDAATRGIAFKMLGDLAVFEARYELARTHYRHARDSFREAKYPGAFVAAIGAMGHCALLDGKYGEALELLSLALNRAERLGDTLLSARLGRFKAHALMQTADFSRAAARLAQSFEQFKDAASQAEISETLLELGEAYFAAGDYQESVRYYRRALTLDGARDVIFKARTTEELYHTDPGNPAEYSAFAQKAPPEIGLAHALAARGELDEANEFYEQALARALACADRLAQARARFYLGDICLARAQFSQASRHYESSQEFAERLGQTELWIDASIRRAYCAFDQGQTHEAYTRLSRAIEWAEATGAHDAEIRSRAHVIYLQLVEFEFQAKGAAFTQLITRAEQNNLPRALLLCQLMSADLHIARHETDQAHTMLESARTGGAKLHEFSLLLLLDQRTARLHTPDHPTPPGTAIGSLLPPGSNRP